MYSIYGFMVWDMDRVQILSQCVRMQPEGYPNVFCTGIDFQEITQNPVGYPKGSFENDSDSLAI
ncbi:hypothetical protein [Roseofilum sp. Guam]|uniref:hypothetical protein n=1 Tax=Roseofilum sp. Guam TaxID=2821502 RepID=UPI001B2131E6|nr:hypothetical protein [Roseofilum sp. Guam]MBP0029602.1 hypothetical protein [Roseofilum sp. Guam]